MKHQPQSPRDKILWKLTNYGGMMERSALRRRMGIRYANLDPIREALEKEGRISGRRKEMIRLSIGGNY